MLGQLKGVFDRPANSLQSTQFSFSRFLTPWLAGYEGWALFMDCDMVMLEDIARLWELRDERFAVQVVKHAHVPKEDVKFLGHAQTKYEKKNWSSVMLMNCARCEALTPEYVNTASGLELHQFKWLGDDALIGELPSRWNHLVGYDPPRRDAALVHFTIGGPWFDEYRASEHAGDWFREREAMLSAQGKQDRK
jgi:lipopolysaccharide biosynthesis glycosyltransferase